MDRRFEATDLFDVMDHAERYNRHLLAEVLGFAGGARRVLDFGAGTGRLSRALATAGFAVTGVEPDPALRARLAARGVTSVASLEALGDECFEYVVSLNVLEHCADDAAVARALHERLRPGGRCLVYVPAFELLWTANDDRVGHRRRYRRAQLMALFRDAGFASVEAWYVDSLGFPVTLAYRLVGRRDGALSARAVRFYDRVVFPVSRTLDRVLHPPFGKNLLLRARRAGSAALE